MACCFIGCETNYEEPASNEHERKRGETAVRARVSFRSVFPVDGARLAIGHFNRPLLDAECRKLRIAWERSKLPRVEDFEVTSKQVSFVTPPVDVDTTWRRDRLGFSQTPLKAKASLRELRRPSARGP